MAYAWIKGHQDRLNSYDSLPFLVRLNVSADFLATRYRLRGKLKSSQRVDHDPSQKISISIHGCRLTSQYDDCLRFHINGYHLRQYIQDKREWSDKVWDDVDFDIFGTHFRRLRPSQRTQHLKLVHDQLPLGWRRRQQSATNDQHLETCPCCLSDKETTEHFLRCHRNDQLFEGRSQILKDSYEKSPHLLRHLLMDGIRYWQHTGNQDFYPTTMQQYPQHMREAVHNVLHKQSAIGWDNALRGYLSKAWIHLASIDKDDASKQLDSRLARQRMLRTISALHEYTRSAWINRNQLLHSTEHNEAERIRSSHQSEIRHFFLHRDKVCFEDQYLFRFTLEQILRAPKSTQVRWLRRAVRSADKKKSAPNTQMLMTNFFQPKPTL